MNISEFKDVVNNNIVFIINPVSDNDISIEEHRIESTKVIASQLMSNGLFVYSPVAFTNSIPYDFTWEYLLENSLRMMELTAEYILLLKMPGWKNSNGIQVELKNADKLNIPVYSMSFANFPNGWTNVAFNEIGYDIQKGL